MLVKKAYKYRFYPTQIQIDQLARTFGCARFIYNWGLKVRTDAFYQNQERLYYKDLALRLTAIKKDQSTEWLNEVSNVVLQQSLRHLDTAFSNFFAGRAKYPAFKKKTGWQSASYMQNGFTFKAGQIRLAKQDEPLNIRWSRPLPEGSVPSSVSVTRSPAGRYYISLLVEEKISPLPVTTNMVGLDMGLTDIVITSNGMKSGNPKYLQQKQKKLQRYQRIMARKLEAAKVKAGIPKGTPIPKGKKIEKSKNFIKATQKVARQHERVGDTRRDFQHKLTTALVNNNQVIAVEDLNVKGMVRNPKLARSISDVGWSEIARQLEYKAHWYGRQFVRIDQWFPSSKRCSGCGHILDRLPLQVRHWHCPVCGMKHDRDINAAKNILSAGCAMLSGAGKLRDRKTTGGQPGS